MVDPVLQKEDCTISSDKTKLDIETIHAFLTEAYWSKDQTIDEVKHSIDHSLCYGLYHKDTQAGFARVITDGITFAYLCDVFILPKFQGKGLGKWLVENILSDPRFDKVKRWLLLTNDAQELYRKFEFQPHPFPERVMVKGRKG